MEISQFISWFIITDWYNSIVKFTLTLANWNCKSLKIYLTLIINTNNYLFRTNLHNSFKNQLTLASALLAWAKLTRIFFTHDLSSLQKLYYLFTKKGWMCSPKWGGKLSSRAFGLWQDGPDFLMHVAEEVDVGVARVARGRPVLA